MQQQKLLLWPTRKSFSMSTAFIGLNLVSPYQLVLCFDLMQNYCVIHWSCLLVHLNPCTPSSSFPSETFFIFVQWQIQSWSTVAKFTIFLCNRFFHKCCWLIQSRSHLHWTWMSRYKLLVLSSAKSAIKLDEFEISTWKDFYIGFVVLCSHF